MRIDVIDYVHAETSRIEFRFPQVCDLADPDRLNTRGNRIDDAGGRGSVLEEAT